MLRLGFLFLLFFDFQAWGAPDAFSKVWMRLYHYQPRGSGWSSPILNREFYFSALGSTNPHAEFQAAIEAFGHPETLWGAMQLPAACAFPARREVLEKEMGLQFPQVSCPDLVEWLKGLHADRVSLLFAGAYAANPASMFGHTLLRFYDAGGDRDLGGDPFLSYAVGFAARSDPADGPLAYVLKGVGGGYLGFYEISQFYVKIGLYNDSESRDIWEQRLNVSPEEVRLLSLHLWEMAYNAKMNYYFAGANCSYRLLTLIEGIRPDLDLTSQMGLITLPPETWRLFEDQGLLVSKVHFYPSIQRKNHLRWEKFSSQQKQSYLGGRTSMAELSQIEDPDVLDALVQTWTYRNYKAQGKPAPGDRNLMEASFERRAAVGSRSTALPLDDEIAVEQDLRPPAQGARPRWISVFGGSSTTSSSLWSFSSRAGDHGFEQRSQGYERAAAIEYLGVDLEADASTGQFRDWELVIARVKSTDDFSQAFPDLSWQLNAEFKRNCELCETDQGVAQFGGGGGLSHHFWNSQVLAYLMPVADFWIWRQSHEKIQASAGFELGAKLERGPRRFVVEGRREWVGTKMFTKLSFEFSMDLQRDLCFIGKADRRQGPGDETREQLGFEYHF